MTSDSEDDLSVVYEDLWRHLPGDLHRMGRISTPSQRLLQAKSILAHTPTLPSRRTHIEQRLCLQECGESVHHSLTTHLRRSLRGSNTREYPVKASFVSFGSSLTLIGPDSSTPAAKTRLLLSTSTEGPHSSVTKRRRSLGGICWFFCFNV